jgi:hypothetical protein
VIDLIKRLLVKDPSRRLVGEEIQGHSFYAGVSWSDLTSMRPPLIPTLQTDDDSAYFPSVHNDAIEASMLEELAHERCHEGNPFFALSCRCWLLAASVSRVTFSCRESGVVVASPMLRSQSAAHLSRRRMIGDSVADFDPQELLRVLN